MTFSGDSLVVDLQPSEMESTLNTHDITEDEQESKPKIKKEVKKKRKLADLLAEGIDPTKLEENSDQVRDRFSKGCECDGDNCFRNMNPEFVFRHRLNIAELTKNEHDMYLMGVTMACLANPEETSRHKERKRLRASYVFQGKKICLDAFLYLENCTHYQLKAIRKHVMVNGVTPRVHGNHGKKPPNTFPLDTYQHAAAFLQSYISRYSPNSSNSKKANKSGKAPPVYLPVEITRKKIHNAYREYCEHFEPDVKVMGYSSFRHFMKEQFPNVKFFRMDKKVDRNGMHSDDDDDDAVAPTPSMAAGNQVQQTNDRTAQPRLDASNSNNNQQQVLQQVQHATTQHQQQQQAPPQPQQQQQQPTQQIARQDAGVGTSTTSLVVVNAADPRNTTPPSTSTLTPITSTSNPPNTLPPPSHAIAAPMTGAGGGHPSMVATAISPGTIYPTYSHVQLPLNLQTQQPLYSACMQPFPPGQPPPPPAPPAQSRPTGFPYANL